jgi:hypothetical protein
MQTSTALEALAGGAMIGAAASLFLLTHGRIAGVSGLLGGALHRDSDDRGSRLGFVLGLLLAGVVGAIVAPSRFGGTPVALPLVGAAGLLVGFGTRLGNGCTSGHGVCGLSRFSLRSLAATMTFMIVAAITVLVVREAGGWS